MPKSRIRALSATRSTTRSVAVLALGTAIGVSTTAVAAQSPAGAPQAKAVPAPARSAAGGAFADRGDIKDLPAPIKNRLIELDGRPTTFEPMQVFAEAPDPSQLFGYALTDTTHFQPDDFTTTVPGVNDGVAPSTTGANHDLPAIGAFREVLEPKPGLPTDPNDPGAFIDMFTDISGLFVINNESGWYEGWLIHDVTVPNVAAPRADGHAAFGTITAADAKELAEKGDGHDVPGAVFTVDGKAAHLPAATDHWPDRVSNTVPLQISLGAYNATQQSDAHSYWEFNQYTDWAPPTYELPVTGGLPGLPEKATTNIVPGSGPEGVRNSPATEGDNPNIPRDPDRIADTSPTDADRPGVNNNDHKETRLRFLPSGLANEVLLDAYVRVASFEPYQKDLKERIYDAYAAEVDRISSHHNGIVTVPDADLEGTSDGGQSNDRLFLPATAFTRLAVTREINDGLLNPRFAPSQRAWVLSGNIVPVTPAIPASTGQDGENR